MLVICSRNDLMKSVGIVSKAVSTRTTMPILEDILLEAGGETLTLLGNDLELGIQTSIDAVVKEEGSIAVNARMFSEIIRRLNCFNFDNVQMMAEKEEENARISAEEMKKRKLDPELKRKLRMRILGETIADTVLPLPVQLAYHAYQMVTLKEL